MGKSIGPAYGGNSATTVSEAIVAYITTLGDRAYSASSFAAKGSLVACTNDVAIKSITVPVGTEGGATYNFVIAEVSGPSDTIDVILAVGETTASTLATNPYKVFAFPNGAALVQGRNYALMLVRNDGVGTAINRCSFPIGAGHTDSNLSVYGAIKYATASPQVGDDTQFDLVNATEISVIYAVA